MTATTRTAVRYYFIGIFGDPIDIASGKIKVSTKAEGGKRFAGLLDEARRLLYDERFFNWQVTFPGVWSAWESDGLNGGFDAVIGNPPWDRMRVATSRVVRGTAARDRHGPASSRPQTPDSGDLEKARGDPLARRLRRMPIERTDGCGPQVARSERRLSRCSLPAET